MTSGQQPVSTGLAAFPVNTAGDLPAWALRSLVADIDKDLARAERHVEEWKGTSAGYVASGEAAAYRHVLAMLCGTTGGRDGVE